MKTRQMSTKIKFFSTKQSLDDWRKLMLEYDPDSTEIIEKDNRYCFVSNLSDQQRIEIQQTLWHRADGNELPWNCRISWIKVQ